MQFLTYNQHIITKLSSQRLNDYIHPKISFGGPVGVRILNEWRVRGVLISFRTAPVSPLTAAVLHALGRRPMRSVVKSY